MDPRFWIVLILAGAIAVSAVVVVVGVALTGRVLGAEAVNAVSMFFGTVIGVIAGYVGGREAARIPPPAPPATPLPEDPAKRSDGP
jgi:hypothetical protein